MRAQQLVIWGKERPDTLIWLLVEANQSRQLLGAEDNNVISRLIRLNSENRGIPLIFPLQDLDTTSIVTSASSFGAMTQALFEHSLDYGVESVAVGIFKQSIPGLWERPVP